MSDEQKQSGALTPGKAQARDERQAKLAQALRANLRRRKPPAPPAERSTKDGDA
ncbi:hypothetical protein [Caulobacter sp. 17J80-11]|uniref:hypothetical protein n=1 Tax=Caulobacter sp. 17J80-11 TaxID=2763502 RepID=UPI001653853B|nr:hypothetical protein [Caulobacter sp. 17J80-11]MBC6983136.1 hypothetical protein [Caulobacter sp. 17J80-11]